MDTEAMKHDLLPARPYDALLLDMDGTVVNSIEAAERIWGAWGERYGIAAAEFLPTIHGKRGIDIIAGLALPGVDAEAEARAILAAEVEEVVGIAEIDGAGAFLRSLPDDRWGIVTSASRRLALRRIEAAGLPVPAVLVTAEDVEHGKPAPDCFLVAARRMGRRIEDCLVFEDSPAGIQAAETAGAAVVVVTATHNHPMRTRHPTISGYRDLPLLLPR